MAETTDVNSSSPLPLLATRADCNEELFLLQIQVADLQSQLDIIQARISALTEKLEVKPILLSAPTDDKALAIWKAAGLQDGALLEDGLRTLEHWIWTQSNALELTRKGWIQFVYSIFGESLDKILEVAH
jgi:hypothetical protein